VWLKGKKKGRVFLATPLLGVKAQGQYSHAKFINPQVEKSPILNKRFS
jgi:hypothetical protein